MEKLKVGNVIECEVSGITEYGVFVKINDKYDGLIHISEVSKKYISNLNRLYIIGDIISAKIIEIDDDKKQIRLSIKDNIEKKKKNNTIEEKGEGFKPLEEKLDYWIDEKLKELKKNAKTP